MSLLPFFPRSANGTKSIDRRCFTLWVELKVEKLIKLFFSPFPFFSHFVHFLFNELNRKSHHIKEPQILWIPFSEYGIWCLSCDFYWQSVAGARVHFSLVVGVAFGLSATRAHFRSMLLISFFAGIFCRHRSHPFFKYSGIPSIRLASWYRQK